MSWWLDPVVSLFTNANEKEKAAKEQAAKEAQEIEQQRQQVEAQKQQIIQRGQELSYSDQSRLQNEGLEKAAQLSEEERDRLIKGGYLPNFQQQLDSANEQYLQRLPYERENDRLRAKNQGDQVMREVKANTYADVFKHKIDKYADSLAQTNAATIAWLTKPIR